MKNGIKSSFVKATALQATLSLLALLAIAFCLIFPSNAAAQAKLSVNLQEFPLYLKRDFNPQDAMQPALEDGSWLKKSPFSTVLISQLDFPGLPTLQKRTFLSPFAQPEEEFTFALPFTLNGLSKLDPERLLGLFLPGIGDNWEIYLNGTRVRSEMHLAPGSLRILEHHSERAVFFPLSAQWLRDGDNLLVFRIIGDPTDKTVGFQYSSPITLGDYQTIVYKNDETLEIILIGGYLLIAVYHFLLFAIRRKDRHNLFFGLFSALMSLYYLVRTHSIYHYLADTVLVVKIEFFCIFLIIPALGFFAETLCVGKISRISKIYGAFFAFLAVAQAILPRPFGSDALIVWQIASLIALLYILFNNILRVFIRDLKEGRKQHLQQGTKAPGIGYFLLETCAGNLLVGLSFFVTSAIIDILDSLFFHYALNLTRYSLYLFVMTITLMLARIYGKLNNALQAKRIFLANVSHEIRTPLNVIMGTTEQLVREQPPASTLTKLARIQTAGAFLTSIVGDILDFSRLEAGKMTIINREYRFRPLVDEISELITQQLVGTAIHFEARIDPSIPETLIGDALRLRQILLNLLRNAVKFTMHGRIEFTATLRHDNKQSVLELAVSDTGKGIHQKNLRLIFTEFYQLDSRLHQNTEGAGLGLSICQNLCALMGGTINVRSDYGKGSTFTVTLPQQPGTGEIANDAMQPLTLREQGIGFCGANVLVVDDLESNREVLFGLLAPYGLELHVATNGTNALEMAAEQAYTLIFMDHIMEDDLDGVATAQRLRQLPAHSHTPIVALTANAMSGMREFFLANGFQDYLSKPIDPLLLDAVLAAWLPHEKRGALPALPRRELLIRHELNVSDPHSGRLVGLKSDLQFAPQSGQYPANSQNQPSEASAPATFAGAVEAEITLQRLNLLNHYRWHFTHAQPTDAAYYQKFTALLTELTRTTSLPAQLRSEAQKLAHAGEQSDTDAIRRDLPDLYNALANFCHGTEHAAKPEEPDQEETRRLRNHLLELKEALEKGRSADTLMAELRDAPLTATQKEVRELYCLLYDLLMMGETEKACGALALWARVYYSIPMSKQ